MGHRSADRVYYAQNREDLILESFFGDVKKGFYVDVGACHPHVASVTKKFYLNGWSGINIEPQQALHEMFVVERKRDINLNIGLSDTEATAVLRTYTHNRGLSTIDSKLIDDYEKHTGNQTEHYEDTTVPMTSLKKILQEQKVKVIHFLKVDVEGYEFQVLNGNDWSKFRPQVICVEANHITIDWRPLLVKNNYSLEFFDGLNEYYVDTNTDRAKKFNYVDHVVIGLKGGIASDDYEHTRESEEKITQLSDELANVTSQSLRRKASKILPSSLKKVIRKAK
jgi:FkbM family methyltransferase